MEDQEFYDRTLLAVTQGLLSNGDETREMFRLDRPKDDAVSEFVNAIFAVTNTIVEERKRRKEEK